MILAALELPHRVHRVFLPLCIAACFFAVAARAQAAGLAVDASVTTHQSAPSAGVTSAPISTTAANDLLVAFITSDGPGRAGGQTFSSVTGGGLTWKLRQRTNAQPGTAEIWEAAAPSALSNVTVTATRSSGSAVGSIAVVAFRGADTTVDGAVASGNATSGGPSATLTATRPGSWVWGVGNDWDSAASRTVGSGQTLFDQYLAGSVGDTYWVQSQTAPGNAANSPVTFNDTAPTNDRWDLSAIEILPAINDTAPPTVPTNPQATANSPNQVTVTWSPSTDDVAVTGYTVLRNGTAFGNAAGTSYVDNTVSPSTTYSYTVEAFDAAGFVSGPSAPASVTTPAAAKPVITNIASNGTDTSSTITWTTDIPSSSQVLYGTGTAYGSSSTLDNTQVRTHSQTLTGLTPNTTYHFAVQSTGNANHTATSGDNTFTTTASNVTLPDMQIKVPTNLISIGTNGSTGHRQLQFTHITWDGGTGPFELDPTYNANTGTATFTQAIYKSTSPGAWTFDHRVPVAATGLWNQATGSDYNFPLTKFTLNTVNPDGSLGSVVATSPKTDYCITGDTIVGGVPNTPNQTYPNQSNCTNPNNPLGWSVGWGDQYDQTDSGQPIDLTGIADGTYVLHSIVDPNHVLTESNPNNNVTDTTLQVAGTSVNVISQMNPGTTPPSVSMTAPANGANVSGTVSLQASASAQAPATVSSVQFLLDGQPLGSAVTAAPYNYSWTVGSTSLGSHTLSARVADSNGNVATAQAITVNVVSGGPPPPPNNPTVSITNPTNGQTASGTTTVAANVTSNLAIASVQFYLDGKPLGSAVTLSPYSVNWDTTTATAGPHTLSAQATDVNGDVGTSSNVNVTVQNPAPPMTCFVLQSQVTAHGSGQVTTPSFHTAMAGEVLLAFVSADGPSGAGRQQATVSGAGLTWTLVKRSNGQPGDAEVWQATAPSVLTSATVTSSESAAGFAQDLTVIAMEGVKGVGASVAGSAASGAPSVSFTTTAATSLVFAVGHDWDNATARTLPSGWVTLDQWVNTGAGDTFWSQYTNNATGPAGSVVAVGDTAPTDDDWNLVGVELLGAG